MAAAAASPSTTSQLRGFRLREMQSTTSDKTFHLKWNNHLQNLSQLFTAIYSSSALADVTLSCRDGAIRAHKLVLSACSPYFEQIFRDNPCKHPVIILKGIPYAEINLLVEFMYKGSVDVQEIDLQSLMHTASELEIRGLAYELRKDASSLLNVNLNEFPSHNSGQESTFATVEAGSHSGDGVHQNNVSRLQQIHLYQQSMCRSGFNTQQLNAACFEGKRKRKGEEPMPATTTTAVKNILAAAAKELAEKKGNLIKTKSSTSIQTEDEDLDVKVELYESDSGETELAQDSEELPHGRDTRFKGKKRVSVGLDDEYAPGKTLAKGVNKQNKKNIKLTFKTPNSGSPTNDTSDDAISKLVITAVTGGDGSAQTPTTGLLKCVNLDNLRENPRESVTIIDDDDSSAVDTSDENNLLIETAYESAPGPDEDYDSSDSKPFRKADDKLYKCDLCHLRFVRKYHMHRHRSTHTGERPFQCDDCPFSFNRSSHLARHRRTHTGERPYRCEACGRTFTRGDKLKLHLRVCEKDEYVLPSHLNNDERKQTKGETSQAVLPGMVSTCHSERHQLMFTSSGDVMLAPRSQSQTHSQAQIQSDADPNTSEMNESNQSLLMMNDTNISQLNLSALATPSTSDSSMLSNQFFAVDALGYPIKRGRGRPRKKPLPVDVPLVKKKRGRPPKVIKLDPNEPSTPSGPVENYNASNLPYGDFSYLTDIISTHFNQTNQAYQNMIQLNPATAANILSNAVAQMQGGSQILMNPSTSKIDIKTSTLNVLSQNNKQTVGSQPLAGNGASDSTEVAPSNAGVSASVKTQSATVNNENAVPNEANKSDTALAEGSEKKIVNVQDVPGEGDLTVKLQNVSSIETVTGNNESTNAVPMTVGECTIKAISNN